MAYCIDCEDHVADLTLIAQSAEEALEEIVDLLKRGFAVYGVSTTEGEPVSLFELHLLATRNPITVRTAATV